MKAVKFSVRALVVGVVLVAVVAGSGCGWFRKKSDYQSSAENRPLEVPPDLTMPRTSDTMRIPSVAGATGTAAASGAISGFQVADSADSAWRRIGIALGRINGVTINNRAEALRSYEVAYGGQVFLVAVQADGGISNVSALGADGQMLASGPATELLGLLRSRLN
jgi:hypothetical protein